jgi:hypothetical protein
MTSCVAELVIQEFALIENQKKSLKMDLLKTKSNSTIAKYVVSDVLIFILITPIR